MEWQVLLAVLTPIVGGLSWLIQSLVTGAVRASAEALKRSIDANEVVLATNERLSTEYLSKASAEHAALIEQGQLMIHQHQLIAKQSQEVLEKLRQLNGKR